MSAVIVTRPRSSRLSAAVTDPSGPSITWSMPAAMRSRLRLVMCTSTARSSCVECSSASSGAASAAAARGSLVSTGTGSLATSSLWMTTRSGPSSGSTSKRMAAAERCVKETSRVVLTRTAPPVEPPLVAEQLAVADVEGLVVHQQPDDLAVRDVDDGLPVLRVAVGGLRVRQRSGLVVAVEVGAREPEGLALV